MIGVEILLIFLVVSFTTYYAMNYWKTQRFRELVEKLPGHDGLSIWKSLYLLFTTKRKDYVPVFLSYVMDEYPMTKAWWLNQFLILTKDADFIHKVFNCNKTYNKPQKYYQGFVVKNSLLVMSGPDHKRHRKILNKAFTSNMLERLPEIFDEKSKKILDMMEERVDCGEFELTEYLGAYSFEAFGKSNFNYEMDYYRSDIYYAYESFCSLTVNIIPFLLAGISRKILNLTKLGKDLLKVEDTFHKFYDKVCKKNQNPADRIENSLVDLLLDPNNEFDEKEIKSELIMTMFGSFETTTRTVSIALMMLGMHKNVKDKAMKEINDIYSQEVDTEFTVEFLQKFTYLDLILKETMRLYAVAPIVSRETSDEVNINGYLIPKNTPILIMMYNMQRDKKYWGDDAEKFRPERFEEELINPHAYTPFTDGNRICIGYRYSLISMKIFLINFLRKYDVSCATKLEDIETEMTFTLNFVNGYKVGISKK